MKNPHPAVVGYRETFARDFPLILIVGREPNSDDPGRSTGLGEYDFDKARRCAFWNTSYGALASSVGKSTAQMKELCRQIRGSPIVYSDALPYPVLNAVRDKRSARKAVPPEDIRSFIDEVFSYTELTARINAVVLSGLGSDFSRSVDAYRAHCDRASIPLIEAPFFYGTNGPRIEAALSPHKRLFASVLDAFARQPKPTHAEVTSSERG